MEARSSRALFLTRKTSRRSSGVLAAKRSLPVGDSARGRTWPLSKTVKRPGRGLKSARWAPAPAAPAGIVARRPARTNKAIRDETERRTRYGLAIGPPERRCIRCILDPQGKRRFSRGESKEQRIVRDS